MDGKVPGLAELLSIVYPPNIEIILQDEPEHKARLFTDSEGNVTVVGWDLCHHTFWRDKIDNE